MGHPGGRQVGGGVPPDREPLDAVELPDILQEFVVHVVAFNTDIDHRVEHIGAEGVAQPFRPSRLGVPVELAEALAHPFRPRRPGTLAGHELPIVIDAGSRVPAERRDRRDGVALDMGAVDDPAEHAPDPEDDDHHRAQAQAEPLAEQFDRLRGLAAHRHTAFGWGRHDRGVSRRIKIRSRTFRPS